MKKRATYIGKKQDGEYQYIPHKEYDIWIKDLPSGGVRVRVDFSPKVTHYKTITQFLENWQGIYSTYSGASSDQIQTSIAA